MDAQDILLSLILVPKYRDSEAFASLLFKNYRDGLSTKKTAQGKHSVHV